VVDPLGLDVPAAAYDGITRRWRSPRWWRAHALAVYDAHYARLRSEGAVPSVSRARWIDYLEAESRHADKLSGRDCRPTVAALMAIMDTGEMTVHRCRRLAKEFGIRTEVVTGRHRTKAERLDSWRRGDRGRGWASVAALHESHLPVDNSEVKTRYEQGFVTPLPHSGGSRPEAPAQPGPSPAQPVRGRAFEPEAMQLANSVRRDARFPSWVRSMPRARLAAVLTRYAVARWRTTDVFTAMGLAGVSILERPVNPAGYLAFLLRRCPIAPPPGMVARAAVVAKVEAERAATARYLAQLRAKTVAGPDSPGRAAAMAIAGRVLAGERRRASVRLSTEELARRARVARGGDRATRCPSD
jgi:hypothetical protein